MSTERTLPEAVAAAFGRVHLLVYVALILVGGGVIVDKVYQAHVDSEVARDHQNIVLQLLHEPIAGVVYELKVYQVYPWMRPLQFNGPLTTRDSYSFEITPHDVSDCSQSPIRQVQIEFLSPAFAIDPPDRQSHLLDLLRQNYCVATPQTTSVTYHWDVLAKQEGHHVVSLRIVGLDSRGNQANEGDTIEVPVLVTNGPFTAVPGIVSTLGALLGLVGVVAQLWTGRTK